MADKEKTININFRATEAEREQIKAKAKENGFDSVSNYLKFVALSATVTATVPKKGQGMKKILLATALLVGLSSTANAEINKKVKKQCKYVVYGSGNNARSTNMYMLGLINGQGFIMNANDYTSNASKLSKAQIEKRACREAFNNKSTDAFSDKYQWGVVVTINKQYSQHSTLK